MPIACELASAARSNREAAQRARRLARQLNDPSEIERVELYAAELECQAAKLEGQMAQVDRVHAPPS